jgi:hypothetical protein
MRLYPRPGAPSYVTSASGGIAGGADFCYESPGRKIALNTDGHAPSTCSYLDIWEAPCWALGQTAALIVCVARDRTEV